MRHKDGLTAKCPHFRARVDYQGEYEITCDCRCGNATFETRALRDRVYKEFCCAEKCECVHRREKA